MSEITQAEAQRIAEIDGRLARLESAAVPASVRMDEAPSGAEYIKELGRRQEAGRLARLEQAHIEAQETTALAEADQKFAKARDRRLDGLRGREG